MILTMVLGFVTAFIAALVLTPLVARGARRYGLVDLPSHRKVHLKPIPRVGGIAIFTAFVCGCGVRLLMEWSRGAMTMTPMQLAGLLGGATVAFGIGLLDDARGLRPGVKLLIQVAAALVAYSGGIAIKLIDLPLMNPIQLGWLALPVTVFWFVLIINAVNLIDGLDGLAAGITFFSCLVLIALSFAGHAHFVVLGLAPLAGATLGFLRYNFNPARIFMGDCGSYFIGFTLAALSIFGEIKTQTSVTILIPVIALGLPLMEVAWSAIRRFIVGRNMFCADNDHLHHRLLRAGYTHRRAVLVLYGFALVLGAASVLMVQADDRVAGIILVAIGVTMAVVIRKLGYVDYLTTEKLIGWVRDFSDVIGVERGGRTFLGIEVALLDSESVDELWIHLQDAARHLRMDSVSLDLNGAFGGARFCADLVGNGGNGADAGHGNGKGNGNGNGSGNGNGNGNGWQ